MEFDWTIKHEDNLWLAANQPGLNFCVGQDGILELIGDLNFRMLYKSDKTGYIINPKVEELLLGELIEDSYKIRIRFEKWEHSNLPQVFETDERIKKSWEKWEKGKEDLHIHGNGACCLCIKIAEREYLPNGFNFPDFFNNLIIPFFFGQSYFGKKGNWPWYEWRHGYYAAFDWYYRNDKLSEEDIAEFVDFLKSHEKWDKTVELLCNGHIKGDGSCICRGKKIVRCDKSVLPALWKMKRNFNDFKKYIDT